MADIKLNVDVDYAPSLANFQSNISRIVNQINGNPLKIKVRVDAGSFKNELATLVNQLRSLQDIKVSPFGPSTGSSVFRSGTTSYLKQMDAMVNLQKSIQSNITRYSGNTSISAPYNDLKNQLEAISKLMGNMDGRSVESVKQEFAQIKLNADQASAAITKIVEEEKKAASIKLSSGTIEYNNALKKISNLYTEITANAKKWKDASEGSNAGTYNQYVAQAQALEELRGQLERGELSTEQFKAKFSEISTVATTTGNALRESGAGATAFANNLNSAVSMIARFVSATRIIYAAINTMKQMFRNSIEIESAMNRIQIVTGATDQQMSGFFEAAAAQARELGASITDIAGSIETFSRLGYSLNDASQLSKYATIMSNVADTDTKTATTGITSIIKAYGMDVSNVEHVSDVLIQVGQKYAISAEELMQAFERGGAAMAASNTSFEQTAALFAATNASLQNASTTGMLWKTNYCLCA